MRKLWIAVFVAGIILRVAFIWRPTDYRLLNAWRECDYTSIARSFSTEGMNILYPRVDWRGDTPGFVEMEFPVIPWVAAVFYHLTGYHEEILRVLSAACSILALFAFGRLARWILPPSGALVATALFACNGLLFALSGAIQPESLEVLCSILAASAIYRWYQTGSGKTLLWACALTALAILIKTPAAHLGLLLAFCVLRKMGRRAFTLPIVYLAALVALAPPVAWYVWAHQHFVSTGLSLGISNETHFLSWELLARPWEWMWGIAFQELINAFAIAGVLLAGIALTLPWKKIEFAMVWYLSVLSFYIISADTSGDAWAYYYHCLSVPPACLLMGWGYLAMRRDPAVTARPGGPGVWRPRLGIGVVALTIAGTLIWGAQRQYRALFYPSLKPLYECAVQFRAAVPIDAKIVVRGGTRLDPHGHPVAYNESMAFLWMDRKGFNYANEEYSEAALRSIAERGGRYWLAGPDDRVVTHVYASLVRNCILVDHCEQFDLFDLAPLARRVELQPH